MLKPVICYDYQINLYIKNNLAIHRLTIHSYYFYSYYLPSKIYD